MIVRGYEGFGSSLELETVFDPISMWLCVEHPNRARWPLHQVNVEATRAKKGKKKAIQMSQKVLINH